MTVQSSAGLQVLVAGPPGKSAYQLALDNGYVGTVTQWLASLQGASVTGAPGTPGAPGPATNAVPLKVSGTSATIPSGYTYIGVTLISAGGITINLPLASTYSAGSSIRVVDESGTCSATLPITIVRNGSDTIVGQATETLETAYQRLTMTSSGGNLWTIE